MTLVHRLDAHRLELLFFLHFSALELDHVLVFHLGVDLQNAKNKARKCIDCVCDEEPFSICTGVVKHHIKEDHASCDCNCSSYWVEVGKFIEQRSPREAAQNHDSHLDGQAQTARLNLHNCVVIF